MKTTVNNSYFYAFYKSGYFIPFFIFTILSLINNVLFWYKNIIDYDWRYFLALWGGFSHDLLIFSLITLLLSFICKYFPKLKVLSLLILYLLFCLPVFDYFYFRATLERFNWVVLQFVNYHSFKGYIGNMGMGLIFLAVTLIFLSVLFFFNSKREKFAEPFSLKLVAAIVIFFFFASLFTNIIVFPVESLSEDEDTKVVFWGHKEIVEGKNRVLKNLSSGSMLGFVPKMIIKKETQAYKEYTDKEKLFLEENGLLAIHNKNIKEAVFNKVIMIVLESFAYEYIHAVNSDIPAEASPFLDYLINNYPHMDNFYTSDFPSLQGFNVILSSKIPFDETNHIKQEYNLASLFESKYSDSTWFLRGSSKVYGNEELTVKKVFGFSNLIGYEDLAKKYPEPVGFVWGYLDDVLYDKAYDILKNENSRLMVIKLLNQHQPAFQDIVNAKDMAKSVSNHSSDIVTIVYDADKQLKAFVDRCEKSNIVDDNTLIIITADHYPPLGYGHTELIKSDYHLQLGKLPLIFYTKRKEPFKDLNKDILCCQLDIAPTLCELLGFDIPKEYMGQSLLSDNYKPRSIGVLNNEKIFYISEKLYFSENLINPATETVVIRKWINNLTAKQ